MSLEKQWRMVQLLLEKTERGELEWKSSPIDNVFQLSFQQYTLLLRQTVSEELPDTYDFRVTLLNEDGDVADVFTDGDLISEFDGAINERNMKPYPVMTRLYEKARRRALGADHIIDKILTDLGDNPF